MGEKYFNAVLDAISRKGENMENEPKWRKLKEVSEYLSEKGYYCQINRGSEYSAIRLSIDFGQDVDMVKKFAKLVRAKRRKKKKKKALPKTGWSCCCTCHVWRHEESGIAEFDKEFRDKMQGR